jgi:hypothetical protein
MNDNTRANISEHCKWVEKMLDKEHEAEIKELKDLLHRADNKLPIQDRTGLSQEIKQALKK